jgi:hypothetical protein
MMFKLLDAEKEKELYRLSRLYWEEALRCEKAKANLAGCVMLGSALETYLILMVNTHPEEAESTGRIPGGKNPKPLLDWNLGELLRVAKEAQWLPAVLDLSGEWDDRKARIGDHAEVLRLIRNLAHPARYAQDHPRKRITPKYLQRQFDVVLACRDWLVEHNSKTLLGFLKTAGLVKSRSGRLKS